MENLGSLVLEISSDEEMGFGDGRKGSYCDVGFGDGDDYNWLSELLGEVERSKDDDSDDVVIVDEVFPRPTKKSRLQPSLKVVDRGSGGDDDDDDGDFVVLKEDPEKAVAVANGNADNSDDDDLEIVGEKGEVACRDFPHPRHLCANFPFASTRHDVHCCQCHCYVCDSLAPCAHWGTGISSIDHCHASDKEEYWKAERKNRKEGCNQFPVTPVVISPTIQDPTLAPPQPGSLLHNQGFQPVMIRPCSTSANASVPNVSNQGRCKFPRYWPLIQSVSSQSSSTFGRNLLSGNKSHNAGNRGPHLCPPLAVFKRAGFTGALPDHHGYNRSLLSGNPSRKRHHALQTPLYSHVANSVSAHPDLSHSQRSPYSRVNFVESRNQLHSLRPKNSIVRDPALCEPQMTSQTHPRNNYVNTMLSQMPVSSQTNAGNFDDSINIPQYNSFTNPLCPMPSQATSSIDPVVGFASGYEQHLGSLISNVGNTHENQDFQPYNHSSIMVPDFVWESQAHSGRDTREEYFSLAWDALGHQNPRIPPGTSRLQSVPADHSTEDDTVHNSTSLITNPDPPFDNWVFEDQSWPGSFEVPMSPYWNAFSPEPGSVDVVANLFDI